MPETAASPLRIAGAVPILLVRDVTRAAGYYGAALGFAVDFLYGEPPFYGAVSRDGACLHLRYVREPNLAELATREPSLVVASMEVSDVRALHAELARRGASIVQGLEEHDWGGTEFQVQDPDGNRVSFVQYRVPDAV